MQVLLSLLLAFLLASCASTGGKNFNETNVSQLHPGMTEQEVIQILEGKPSYHEYHADGTYTASWIYTRANALTSSVESKLIYILFDKNHRFVRLIDSGKLTN